jgi:hypothetical protein
LYVGTRTASPVIKWGTWTASQVIIWGGVHCLTGNKLYGGTRTAQPVHVGGVQGNGACSYTSCAAQASTGRCRHSRASPLIMWRASEVARRAQRTASLALLRTWSLAGAHTRACRVLLLLHGVALPRSLRQATDLCACVLVCACACVHRMSSPSSCAKGSTGRCRHSRASPLIMWRASKVTVRLRHPMMRRVGLRHPTSAACADHVRRTPPVP